MGDQFHRVGKGGYQIAGTDPKTKKKDITAALRELQSLKKGSAPATTTAMPETMWHWVDPSPTQEVDNSIGGIEDLSIVEGVGDVRAVDNVHAVGEKQQQHVNEDTADQVPNANNTLYKNISGKM